LIRWKKTRTGLVIGQALADKFGWKIGDKVSLSSSIWMNKSGSFNWPFTVSAIYKTNKLSGNNNKVFFQHTYFDKGRAYARNSMSWLSTEITDKANVDDVIFAIDNLFIRLY
jgi:putative ABC transport system permease protein